MKKILLYIPIIMLVFWACEPMEDVYDELDEKATPYNEDINYTFTDKDYTFASIAAEKDAADKTDSTYAKKIASDLAFNEYFSAAEYVGKVLANNFSALKLNSTALVTYNNYLGGLEYLNEISNADSYELVADDYDSMGEEWGEPGKFDNFSSSTPPEDYLPDFLLTKYPSAEAGDIKLIIYDYYSGSVSTRSDYYSFDGTEWSVADIDTGNAELYTLTNDDYDSMGEGDGQPGDHNNFDEDINPDDYLATFLKIKFPYANAGDAKIVIYEWYWYDDGHNTEDRAKEYHFDGTVWTEYDAIVKETNQFVYSKIGWVFDPTIKYKMISADYQMITDAVLADYPEYGYTNGSAEFYYGSASKYANFDLRVSKRNIPADGEYPAINIPGFEDLTDEEAIDLMWSRIPEAIDLFLTLKYPDAIAQTNGVDVYYIITFYTYENDLSSNYYSIKFQCTKDGPSPEFTQVMDFADDDSTVYGKYGIIRVE